MSPDDAGRAATPHSRTTTRCLSLSGLSPHSDHQLDSALRPDALLLEDGPDGCTELVHLIVEVLVATGERLEGDATGERGVTLAGRARP